MHIALRLDVSWRVHSASCVDENPIDILRELIRDHRCRDELIENPHKAPICTAESIARPLLSKEIRRVIEVGEPIV